MSKQKLSLPPKPILVSVAALLVLASTWMVVATLGDPPPVTLEVSASTVSMGSTFTATASGDAYPLTITATFGDDPPTHITGSPDTGTNNPNTANTATFTANAPRGSVIKVTATDTEGNSEIVYVVVR